MTEEQKARKKITKAEWLANRSDEKVAEDKAQKKKTDAEWYKARKEANPEYSKEQRRKHALGYWVVYVIRNYNGLENDYAGQTQNIWARMIKHKHLGKLNTGTHEILEKFDCKFEALAFEATLHLDGYHGKN